MGLRRQRWHKGDWRVWRETLGANWSEDTGRPQGCPFVMKRLIPFLAAALVSIAAHSQPALDPLKGAIAAKQWARADAELLRLQGVPGVDRTELLFLEGMMAMSRNQFDAAAHAFRQILDARPDLLRVRLELARALYLAGKFDAARGQFETVLAADLPEPVAENVRTFLDRIRARRNWRFDVSVGYIADSNANGGSNKETVTINGLSFRLSDDARQSSGSGLDIRASGQYRFPVNEKTRLAVWSDFWRRDYTNSRFDDMMIKLGAGPVWFSRDGELSISPFYAYRTYGNAPYLEQRGVRLDALQKVTTRWLIKGTSEWSYQSFDKAPDHNGPLFWISARAHAVVSTTSSAYAGLSYQREQSGSAFRDSRTWGAVVGASHDWASGVGASAELGVQRQRFLQTQPIFDQQRVDRETVATLRLVYRPWTVFGTSPAIAVSRIRNRSTIDFYSSARTLIQFVGEKRF